MHAARSLAAAMTIVGIIDGLLPPKLKHERWRPSSGFHGLNSGFAKERC